jgi:hypothetical protein
MPVAAPSPAVLVGAEPVKSDGVGCMVLVVGSIYRSATARASFANAKPGGVTNDHST